MSTVGVVLAGGRGRRIGGDKAIVELDGLALVRYPLRALAAVTATQVVVAKRETVLPALPPGVATWLEPAEPRHPLTGLLHALRSARGRPVLCCAVDLPLLDAATLSRLLEADDGRHHCVVPATEAGLEPLCALWHPTALTTLERLPGGLPMRDVVAALDPIAVPFADARPFANVNTPEDLLTLRPPQPNVKA